MSGERRALWLVVALGIALLGIPGCGGSARSMGAFCGEVDKAAKTMRSNLKGIESGDALGDLGAAAANLGELTRLVHRLKDVAPDEIRSDMTAASDAWDKQLDLVGGGAQNLGGTLVAGLFASAASSATFRAVDDFSSRNCGQKIFSF